MWLIRYSNGIIPALSTDKVQHDTSGNIHVQAYEASDDMTDSDVSSDSPIANRVRQVDVENERHNVHQLRRVLQRCRDVTGGACELHAVPRPHSRMRLSTATKQTDKIYAGLVS